MYREHFLTTEKFQKDSGSARTQSDIFPICRHFLHCHTPSTKCGGAPKTFVTLSHVTHRDKEIPYDEGAKCHEILGRFISVMDWVESYLARGIETYVTLLGCRCLTFSLELQKIHQCHLPTLPPCVRGWIYSVSALSRKEFNLNSIMMLLVQNVTKVRILKVWIIFPLRIRPCFRQHQWRLGVAKPVNRPFGCFPGGFLPSFKSLNKLSNESGLKIEGYNLYGSHYSIV